MRHGNIGAARAVGLRSGATLLVDTDERYRGAAIGFWFDFGSASEADDERGFTHFVEHMVFKGTARRSAEDIAREIDRTGGYLNAYTEREETCFHALVPADAADLAVDVVSDMLVASRFDPKDFELERDVIRNETLSALDEPEEAGADEFAERLWPDCAYGRRVAGTPDDVARVDRDRLYAFYRERFDPARMLVVVSGAADADGIARKLDDAFAVRAEAAPPKPTLSPRATIVREARRADIAQTHFYAAIPFAPPFASVDYWKLAIASSAFGDASSSRMFLELREKRGLCYQAGSGFSLTPLAGTWNAFAATTPDKFPMLVEVYDGIARDLFERGLTRAEFDEAASRVRGSLALGSDDLEYRGKRLARQFLFDRRIETLEETVGALDSLTLESVNAFIAERLDPRGESVFAYGKTPRAVREAVKAAAGRRSQ